MQMLICPKQPPVIASSSSKAQNSPGGHSCLPGVQTAPHSPSLPPEQMNPASQTEAESVPDGLLALPLQQVVAVPPE